MSVRRRVALLDWARQADAWIFEDDYDSEFRYAGPPFAGGSNGNWPRHSRPPAPRLRISLPSTPKSRPRTANSTRRAVGSASPRPDERPVPGDDRAGGVLRPDHVGGQLRGHGFCTRLRSEQPRNLGATLSPLDTFLLLQGLETLPQARLALVAFQFCEAPQDQPIAKRGRKPFEKTIEVDILAH